MNRARRTLAVIIAAMALILAAAVPANAARLGGPSYSHYYDGVRIGSQSNGIDIPNEFDAKVAAIEVWAGGDVDTLEGGCTSSNHGVTVRVFLLKANGVILYDSGERWLCESNGWDHYLDVNPDIRVNCDAARVQVNWYMHDNFGGDDAGSFSYYANRCTTEV
jgi:hypothetical protein